MIYQYLANAVLILHVAIVLFIILGLVLTLAGGLLKWQWVRNVYFRAVHLAGIAYIAAEAWLGIICPLTTLELWLRELAGQAVYEGDFIAYWLNKILFYQAPPIVFIVAYSVFGLLVVLSWVLIPPRKPWKRD
ncbi:MAG: DUF2784 domain-containing protein [Pseudomonadota bacterium]